MDEPTSALDASASGALEELAHALSAGGVPIVWVTHTMIRRAMLVPLRGIPPMRTN